MRKLKNWTLFLVAISTCVPIFAATATDFYVELLRRGVAEVEAGRNESAVTPLRLAAFGLIDSIEHYQTAQAYLVVALERTNQTDEARAAALRIIAAERIERKFASLRLPDAIRSSFTTSVKKLLPAPDVALLSAPSTPAKTPPAPPPQTSAKLPQTDAPRKAIVEPPAKVEEPKKVVEKPAVQVAEPSSPRVDVKPAATTTAQAPAPAPANRRPEVAKTTPPKPAPAQIQPQPKPAKPTIDVPARLAAGERALIAASLADARKIYRELLDAAGHDHGTWIRVAEGLYRSRDFPGALQAFQHVGTLRPGEEAYRYYIAVALYETGQYEGAKRELAGALPFIEITPDVERYRAKIDGAR